jgi:lysophospholipase L1-like esterase
MHGTRCTKALLGIATAFALLALVEGGARLTLTRYLDDADGFRRAAEDLHRAYRGAGYAPVKVTPTVRIFGSTLSSLREARFALPKPPHTLRVVLLGDSTAWGLIAGPPLDGNDESSFGPELERQLGAVVRPRHVEVINMGMCGAISEVALALLREAVTFQPDAIVVYVGINDSNLDLIEPTLVPGAARKGWLRRHLRLADLVAHSLTRRRMTPRLVTTRLPVLEANLRRMQGLARRRDVPLLICLPVGREGGEGAAETHLNRVRATVSRAALAGTPLVDIAAAVREAARRRGRPFESFYSDDIHPNREGYALYAGAVVAALRNLRNIR